MPNVATALDQKGCAKGASDLLFRVEVARKVLFVSRFSDEILEKVGMDEDMFIREVDMLHDGNKTAWVKFLQDFKERDRDIHVYLSNPTRCSTKERNEARTLLGDEGLKFFLSISPFAGHEICLYKVADSRIPTDPLDPRHMLAKIAARAGVTEPGESAIIVFSADDVFGIPE